MSLYPPVMMTSSLSGSGMEHAFLLWINWLINGMQCVTYQVSYFRLKPSSTEPSNFTFSVVFREYQPPMRYTPESVAQDTWACLFSLSVCDWFQVPEAGLHLTQEVMVAVMCPPQASPPSWLWCRLAPGNWGSEQLVLALGL